MEIRQQKEMLRYKEETYLSFCEVEKAIDVFIEAASSKMRATLESALKTFWTYKWNCYDPTTNLESKIDTLRRKNEFNIIVLQNMDTIRKCGNNELHNMKKLDKETIDDLFELLKKCLKAIGDKIGVNLMGVNIDISKEFDNNINIQQETYVNDKIMETKEKNTGNIKGEINMKKVSKGERFFGGNADLLNQLGFRKNDGTEYDAWMRGTYETDSNTYIWMESIDGKVRNGWKNVFEGEDTIIERNLDEKVHNIGLTHKYRYVFDKNKANNSFTFRGFYELQPESNNKVRVLKKIADTVEL